LSTIVAIGSNEKADFYNFQIPEFNRQTYISKNFRKKVKAERKKRQKDRIENLKTSLKVFYGSLY